VLGAGVAGLTSALLLARDGHDVVLVERDRLDVGALAEAPAWDRDGIPHFLQPHAFVPRGRQELRRHLPDVLDLLLASGAAEVDQRPKLPGPAVDGDADLQYLAVRRPVLEWALRRQVRSEPRVSVRDATHVEGLLMSDGRVRGVRLSGDDVRAELVVDALGRRTPTPRWLAGAGVAEPPARSSDCGVAYYSRYYRVRDGKELPDGPWFLSPRGDLGYLGFSSFPGDNRTFAALLAVPPGVREWKVLRTPVAFEAALARIPAIAAWTDPELVEPITDVLAMAGLRNTFRPLDVLRGTGLVPVGDARTHTDPVMAAGLTFAVVEAAALARAVRTETDLRALHDHYVTATDDELRERYELATELDAQRLRMWTGQPVDLAHHDGDHALFCVAAVGLAAMVDIDVARAFLRRLGLLDRTAVLDDDVPLQRRAEELFAAMRERPRPPLGPTREEMVELVAGLSRAGARPLARPPVR